MDNGQAFCQQRRQIFWVGFQISTSSWMPSYVPVLRILQTQTQHHTCVFWSEQPCLQMLQKARVLQYLIFCQYLSLDHHYSGEHLCSWSRYQYKNYYQNRFWFYINVFIEPMYCVSWKHYKNDRLAEEISSNDYIVLVISIEETSLNSINDTVIGKLRQLHATAIHRTRQVKGTTSCCGCTRLRRFDQHCSHVQTSFMHEGCITSTVK